MKLCQSVGGTEDPCRFNTFMPLVEKHLRHFKPARMLWSALKREVVVCGAIVRQLTDSRKMAAVYQVREHENTP